MQKVHQGKILESKVKLSPKKAGEVAVLAGISRGTLYEWFKLERLEDYMIEALKKAKIDLSDEIIQTSDVKQPNVLKEALEQIMIAYEQKFKRLQDEHDELKKDHYKLRGEFDIIKGMVIKQPAMAKKS